MMVSQGAFMVLKKALCRRQAVMEPHLSTASHLLYSQCALLDKLLIFADS